MSSVEIVLGVVLGLLVNEATDISPWLGRTLVAWAARLRYAGTPMEKTRSEELQALINSRPGKLFKLLTGLGFASSALIFRLRKLLDPDYPAAGDPVSESPITVGMSGAGDEPTTLVARYLFPTERYRGEWKRHWIYVAKGLGIIALYAVLSAWVVELRFKPQYKDDCLAWITIVASLLSVRQVGLWYFGRLVITNKRLMTTEGLVRRRVRMLPLLRVTDLRYEQSLLGRLLNYGTFLADSGSRHGMREMADLPHPGELYLRIVEEMYEPQAVEARLEPSPESEPLPQPELELDSEPLLEPEIADGKLAGQLQTLTVHLEALTAAVRALTPAASLPVPEPVPVPDASDAPSSSSSEGSAATPVVGAPLAAPVPRPAIR